MTYENGRQRQNVWSKEKWEVPEAGAGAPKPTVLNYAQGKELQAKNMQYRGLTSDQKNDIISMKRIQNRHRSGIAVISDERFNNLTIEARKHGALILRGGAEVEKHLDAMKADASVIGDVILFRQDVCLSEVLEETHHFMQNLQGLNDSKEEPLRTILNEIDAKQYLLDNAQKFSIPRSETELTREQLKFYEEKLTEFLGGEGR